MTVVIPPDEKIVKVEVVSKEEATRFVPYERPYELYGVTYKIRPPTMEAAVYVTINDIELDEGKSRPLEIFINSKDVRHFEWSTALTRLLSGHFRHKSDFRWVIEELRQSPDPSGGYFIPGTGVHVRGVVDHIGWLLEQHCRDLGLIEDTVSPETRKVLDEKEKIAKEEGKIGEKCPKCFEFRMFKQEGCLTCTNCGYSKCEGE